MLPEKNDPFCFSPKNDSKNHQTTETRRKLGLTNGKPVLPNNRNKPSTTTSAFILLALVVSLLTRRRLCFHTVSVNRVNGE